MKNIDVDYLNSLCDITNKKLQKIKFDKIEEVYSQCLKVFTSYKLTNTEMCMLGNSLIAVSFINRIKSYVPEKAIFVKDLLNKYMEINDKQLYEFRALQEIYDALDGHRVKVKDDKKKNIFISMNLSKRFEVLEKYGFKCRYCGKSPPEVYLELEHIIPKCKGGKDTIDNFVPACFNCNRGKRDKILKEE